MPGATPAASRGMFRRAGRLRRPFAEKHGRRHPKGYFSAAISSWTIPTQWAGCCVRSGVGVQSKTRVKLPVMVTFSSSFTATKSDGVSLPFFSVTSQWSFHDSSVGPSSGRLAANHGLFVVPELPGVGIGVSIHLRNGGSRQAPVSESQCRSAVEAALTETIHPCFKTVVIPARQGERYDPLKESGTDFSNSPLTQSSLAASLLVATHWRFP